MQNVQRNKIPDSKALLVIGTVVNRSAPKAIQSSAFQTAVKRAVQKCSAEPLVVTKVATRTIEALIFSVPFTNFVKRGAKKHSLETAETKQH